MLPLKQIFKSKLSFFSLDAQSTPMISNGLTDRLITLGAAAAWELKYYLSLEDTQEQHM